MIGRERRGRDRRRASEARLCLGGLLEDLVDDAEIVEGVGEIGMERPELLFLELRGLAKPQLGGGVVAARRGRFGRAHH